MTDRSFENASVALDCMVVPAIQYLPGAKPSSDIPNEQFGADFFDQISSSPLKTLHMSSMFVPRVRGSEPHVTSRAVSSRSTSITCATFVAVIDL